jgi:hypothetical protein
MALQDSTMGVVINSNGFKTQNGTAGGTTLALNELGISYNYIAFK